MHLPLSPLFKLLSKSVQAVNEIMSNNVNESLALVPKSELSEDGNNNNSSKVIVDSLPYIDYLHPDYEAYALSLIEHEMKKKRNN